MKPLKSNISNLTSLFIVGPTASGKSNLSMDVAREINGEIVCADSQTLRKDLDIGTAKPSSQDRQEIPHHLIDVIDPYERFSVNQFKKLALSSIRDIQERGKTPVIVGGSGLYIDALFFDFELENELNNTGYKQKLEKMSADELRKIITDKKYPMPKNKDNPRHLVGVILRKGVVNKNKTPIKGASIYGILLDDEMLKKRISTRVDLMFKDGFVSEVERVVKKYGQPPKNLDAIGYPICSDYLEGKISLDEAKEKIINAHWQYARRQKSWFKRNPHIGWFNSCDEAMNTIIKDVQSAMNKSVTIKT